MCGLKSLGDENVGKKQKNNVKFTQFSTVRRFQIRLEAPWAAKLPGSGPATPQLCEKNAKFRRSFPGSGASLT